MAIKKLNERKSKQSIEIFNFFRASCCKMYIYIQICLCVKFSSLRPYADAYRFKNKKNQEQRHMLHVCICVCVCRCVYISAFMFYAAIA